MGTEGNIGNVPSPLLHRGGQWERRTKGNMVLIKTNREVRQ